MIITAAEQQTMNFYMNVTNFASSEAGRRLYQEIAMVEEEHVTHYESLMDAKSSWLEKLLWHEYCECYLYWSCYQTETDPYIKNLWEENLHIEIAHLKNAEELLLKYEGKEWQEVISCGDFPSPISLHENIDYVRKILRDTVQYTALKEDYVRVKDLPENADFFTYQNIVNPTVDIVPSHNVIEGMIRKRGADYRYQIAPNPIPELRNRREDNTSVGRKPNATTSTEFTCND
jgi:rubrerythrin